ncbi:MAG: DHH family phosphoesterase [Candidatus Woesearchaeota archaeon]
MVGKKDSQELVDVLEDIKKEGKTLYIVGHVPPDYDSLGGGFGLAHIAKSMGLEAKVCSEFKHDAGYLQNNILYNELDLAKKVSPHSVIGKDDPIAFVDVYPHDTNCPELECTPRIIINHHPIDDVEAAKYAGTFMDARQAGSSIALVMDHMNNLGVELTSAEKDLATLMLYGLRVDTKNYLTATELDFTASPLLQEHADREMIAKITNKRYPREVLKMIKGMDEKEVGNYRFAVVKVSTGDLVRPFADALAEYSGCPMALAVAKIEEAGEKDWLVLGRSNNSAHNVADCIHKVFDTGRGHWYAAGATLTTKEIYTKFGIDESKDLSVLKQVLGALEEKLKKL